MSASRNTYSTQVLIEMGKLSIGDGYRAKNVELSSSGIPFARAGNIQTGFHFDGADLFPVENLNKVGEKVSRPGDVVFTSKGTVGRFACVTEEIPRFVYSPQLCYWRSLDTSFILPHYLYYWMHGNEFWSQASSLKGQTDMADYISLTDQRRMTISLPPLPEQRAIASVLGALDDKIELNRRMNRTLEEMAAALFKSWFVDFDPVHAKAEGRRPFGMDDATAALFPDRFVETEEGLVPEGWRITPLGEILGLVTDGSHRSPPSVEDGLPMASVKDMTPWGIELGGCRKISERDFAELVAGGCQPERGDILLSKDGAKCLETVCEFQQEDKIVLLSSVAILRPRSPDASSYLHIWLSLPSTRSYLQEGFVSGSAIPRIVLKDLKRAELVFPDADVLASFGDATNNIRKMVMSNVNQSRTLANLRDTLLPKLLSGEIRLKQAEKVVEGAV